MTITLSSRCLRASPLQHRNILASLPRRRWISRHSSLFKVSEEVQEAIHSKKPVVALETTIYTHGFPYPDNIALASHLESVVRVNGGMPATIGVLNGVARVGLSPDELIELASNASKQETMKVSRRDLGYIAGMVCSISKIYFALYMLIITISSQYTFISPPKVLLPNTMTKNAMLLHTFPSA